MGPSEIVYRTDGKSEPYAIWGGLPTQASVYPAATGDNDSYGLGQEKLAARRNLAIASATWFDRLLEEHITWVVTDAADVAMNTILDSAEEGCRGALRAQYGAIRIFQIRFRNCRAG